MYLKTKRLLIRSIQSGDVQALAELWTDPAVTRYLGGPRNAETLLKDFQAEAQAGQPDPFDLWPVIDLSSGQVIGHCGLLEKEVEGQPEIEVVYVLSASTWGQGYATEAALALRDYAFDQLGLTRLIALIKPEHQASAHVAQKIGMRLERETVRAGGQVMQVYAINPSTHRQTKMGQSDSRRT